MQFESSLKDIEFKDNKNELSALCYAKKKILSKTKKNNNGQQ